MFTSALKTKTPSSAPREAFSACNILIFVGSVLRPDACMMGPVLRLLEWHRSSKRAHPFARRSTFERIINSAKQVNRPLVFGLGREAFLQAGLTNPVALQERCK